MSHLLRISITTGGVTGSATFKTSLDGGASWSSDTYTAESNAQDLMIDATDTGLDVTFADGASWSAGDGFTIASWWSESGDFPQKAAIIATGVASPTSAYTGSLEIIDMADDTLWMRFVSTPENTGASEQNLLAGPVHALAARNGKLYLGAEDGNMSGLTAVDLMRDTARFYDYEGWGTPGWDWTGTIARRNDGDAPDAGWITETADYPNLSSYVVHDVDVSLVSDTTYVAIGTGDKLNLLNLEANEVYTYSGSNCIGGIPAVALVGNDLYWSGVREIDPDDRYLCARYAITDIVSSGDWGGLHTYKKNVDEGLISNTIRALTGRDGMSPEAGAGGGNIVYVGTEAGLTILHETRGIQQKDAVPYHYGHVGSSNDDLDYKILTGTTDIVSNVDFAEGETAVYVATNDGEGHGGVSVLRPWMEDGDTPYLIASYVSPTLSSNDVVALAHGSDLLVGTAGDGVDRLEDTPTAVGMTRFSARSPGSVSVFALLASIAVLSWIAQQICSSAGHRVHYRAGREAG